MSQTEYVDVRAVHPDFTRRECWNCGHEWTRTRGRRTRTPMKYGKCPDCGWTGSEEINHD